MRFSSFFACVRSVPSARARSSFSAVTLALLISACGGGDGGTTPPATPPTVTLSSSTLELRGLASENTLTATVSPSGASLTWSSDQPAVVTVAANGTSATVRAVAAGTAVITATATANGLRTEARATITVVPLVRTITLAPPTATVVAGATLQLTPTVTADAGASTSLTWTSSDATRATVSPTGLVTAIAPGAVTITATSAATTTVSAQSVITVAEPPRVRTVTVSPTADSALIGATRAFTAAVVADAGLATTVTWRTSTPSVATVTASGVATAIAAGTATITAVSTVDTMVRGVATFNVRAPTVRTVSVSGPSTLVTGATAQATATVTADAGATQTVMWTSSAQTVATVSSTGLITALTPGTTVIRARSTLVPTVEGTLSLTVTLPPVLDQWTPGTLGTIGGQFTDGLSHDVASLDATTGIANYWAFADGASPNYAVRVSNGTVTNVQPPGGGVLFGFTTAEAGVAFGRNSSANTSVWRYASGSWTRLPVDLPGAATNLQALAGGRVRAGVRVGGSYVVQEWDGTTWTQRFAHPLPPSPGGESFTSLNASTMVFTLSSGGGSSHQLYKWDGTTTSALPLVPGNPANLFPTLFGTSLTDLYAISGPSNTRRVHRFDGTNWILTSTGITDDTLGGGVMCQGQPVIISQRGRVYRLSGGTWSRLGTDAEILPNRFFGQSSRPISCAADGTLRTVAGEGSMARWNGSSWVIESLASSLRGVKVVSPTLAWATGGGYSIYRWNGSTWSLAHRDHGMHDQRVMGLAAWPDGKFMGALWSSISPAATTTGGFGPQGILRFDGTTWTRDVGGVLTTANGVWGPRYDNAFAVTGAGAILKFNGANWTTEVNTGTSLSVIDGVGDSYALAIDGGLRTWRWNGSSWTQASVGVGGASAANRLYIPAVDDAWSAAGNVVYRFNGTTWTAVDVTAAGGSTQTWSIFGTGPSDVMVLRGPSSGVRRLYRWNGSAWSTVASFAPGTTDFPEAGSAVPGFGAVVGNAAAWWRGGGATAVRQPLPRARRD